MNAQISPDIRVGFRLVSTANSDDPNSTHVNINNGFNQINVAIDRANVSWSPRSYNQFTLILGKFNNQFSSSSVYPELVWDADIQPEGGVFILNYQDVGFLKNLRWTNGSYLLSQFKNNSNAPWLNANQFSTRIGLSNSLSLRLASGFYYFANIKNRQVTSSLIDNNSGNSIVVDGPDALYATDFRMSDNFVLVDIENLPLPLRLKAQYIVNVAADQKNTGFAFGFMYGKLMEKGNWQTYYQYQEIQQDAVFSPFVQDDFLRQTNFKAHIFGFTYALNSNIALHGHVLTDKQYYGSGKFQTRLRLDLNVKL